MVPLNQSAIHENYQKNPCCRRKTKIINQNNLMHNQPSLTLIQQKNYNIDIDDKTDDIEDSNTYLDLAINSPTNPSEVYKQFSEAHFHHNDYQNFNRQHESYKNLGISFHAIKDKIQKSLQNNPVSQTKTIAFTSDSTFSPSSTKEKQEFSMLSFDMGPDTKQLYNEMNIRELVNTVRTEIGALIDADQKTSSNNEDNSSALKKKKVKQKNNQLKSNDTIKSSRKQSNEIEQCNNCCCNFLHYSLRQVIHDTEQMKQFVLNTAMIGMDPLQLKDPTNTLYPAICIPMYNCENIHDQRFPPGPNFTTISKNELNNFDDHHKINSMIIQNIDTQRGKIQIKLDPQSFGLAPFFSDQYETFIKGPPNSIFFTNYINTYNK